MPKPQPTLASANQPGPVETLMFTGAPKPGPSAYRGNMAAGMLLPGSPGCPSQDPTNPLCCLFDNGVMYQNSTVGFSDITPFNLAQSDPAAYAAQYPGCDYMNADCNHDGVVDFADIDPFVALLGG